MLRYNMMLDMEARRRNGLLPTRATTLDVPAPDRLGDIKRGLVWFLRIFWNPVLFCWKMASSFVRGIIPFMKSNLTAIHCAHATLWWLTTFISSILALEPSYLAVFASQW